MTITSDVILPSLSMLTYNYNFIALIWSVISIFYRYLILVSKLALFSLSHFIQALIWSVRYERELTNIANCEIRM